MSNLDWNRVAEVFDLARCRPPEERPAVLDDLCGNDAAVRSEVQSLLEAHERADGFLEPASFDAAAEYRPVVAPRPLWVGCYRIVSEIGRGGMGRVFLAERAGADYDRAVALKVVDPQDAPEDFLRRFRTERQILARLSHPNIAHLYEGGTTPDGTLYFAMELVEGLAIDVYCDHHRLSVDERLELFGRVCDAVEHAHSHLVVHRDLKPTNVLVTAEGRPKLLDFGIAKPLEPAGGAAAGQATATCRRVLTPLYASPEQLRGEPVTTASDVYSLGVLLYRLLTGRLPRRVEGWGREEVRRVLDQEAVRPSLVALGAAGGESGDGPTPWEAARRRRSEPRKLARRLRGDLDTVVLKCLRVEPERRYASVGALKRDLERSRAGRTIEARPDSFSYRAGRFVRRNRLGVAVAVAVLVLLAASTTALSVMAVRLAAERDEAARGRERARTVAGLLVEVLEEGDPQQGSRDGVTMREVLDRGVESISERFDGQPEIESELLDAFGRIYIGLGLYDRAEAPLERALSLRRASAGSGTGEAAASLVHLCALRRAQGRFDEAESYCRRALAIRRRGGEPERPEVARVLGFLAEIAIVQQRHEEARALLDEGLEIARETAGEESEDFAVLLNLLARLQMQTDDAEAARRSFSRAIEIGRTTMGSDHADVLAMSHNLALVLRSQGDLEGAARLATEVLAAERRLFGREHPTIAFTLDHLGLLDAERGKFEQAESRVREALAMRRKLLGEEHPAVMVSLNALGTVHYLGGDLAAAEASYRRAVALIRGAAAPRAKLLSHVLTGLGRTLLRAGRAREAEGHLAEALALRRQVFEPGHSLVVESQLELSRCLVRLGRREQAARLHGEALAEIERRGLRLSPIAEQSYRELSEIFARGDPAAPPPVPPRGAPAGR